MSDDWNKRALDERFARVDGDFAHGARRMDRMDERIETIEDDHTSVANIPVVVRDLLDAFRRELKDDVRQTLRDFSQGRRDAGEWTRSRIAQIGGLYLGSLTIIVTLIVALVKSSGH